ncbi:MAG TPA: AAA family ATPase [Chloroflexia bacterium]|nr:AAA family ATPase [Chloroflexia bacterium]
MSQLTFGEKVKNYLKAAGSSQKILANKLAIDRTLLTHKLNATGRTALTHPEIKRIVKTLAELEAITARSEALDLLAEANCPDFTQAEWQAPPLKELEEDASFVATARNGPYSDTFYKQTANYSHNLPVQLTSFIGRETEIEQLKTLLFTTHLLTLTGAGGVGKTRLALQVAAGLLESFREGVWLVELAPVTQPELVGQAIVQALGLRLKTNRTVLSTLVDYLKTRQILLVLDNCEHLLEACATLVAGLLEKCPGLRILVTSRETFEINGEVTYRVPSLSLPGGADLACEAHPTLEQLFHFEAVRLFIERARAARPDFKVTGRTAPLVAQLCYHLDGIPLAIELAAARVSYLSVAQILQNLDDRFRLLKAGGQTFLPHHQTLRASIDWSYSLLSRQEQQILSRLAVFAGDFSLEGAQKIGAGEDITEGEGLDYVIELARKSLVQAEEMSGGEDTVVRYRMLETIRQYSLEKLELAGETYRTQLKHLHYYLALARQAEAKLNGAEQVEWLNRLEQELDNIRAALAWALANGLAGPALEIAGCLSQFWYIKGYWLEGQQWLVASVRAEGNISEEVRAKGLEAAADFTGFLGDLELASTFARESWELYAKLGNRRGQAYVRITQAYFAYYGMFTNFSQADFKKALELIEEALTIIKQENDHWCYAVSLGVKGMVKEAQGELEEAGNCYEEGLALCREIDNKREIAWFNYLLGRRLVARQQLEAAIGLFTESEKLFRVVGDRWGLSVALSWLGVVEMYIGNYAYAKILQEEALELFRKINDQNDFSVGLRRLGLLMLFQEDYSRAADLFRESLILGQKLDKKDSIGACLEALGYLSWRSRNLEKAVRLLTTAETLLKKVNTTLLPDERLLQERFIKEAKADLEEKGILGASTAEQALDEEQAIALALQPDQITVASS